MTTRHLVLRAFAKVNLSLEVGRVRSDGYHPYESIAMSVGLCDDLEVLPGPAGGGIRVEIDTGVEDTLVRSGVEVVCGAARRSLDLEVKVRKRIPPGSGLAGGSADAAAAMVAAADLLHHPPGHLAALAAGVGTDVPFCVVGGHARLHGRGEIVEPREPLPAFGVLVAVPPLHVATAEVFSAFDDDPRPAPEPTVPGWLRERLPDCSFRNDLEPAALRVVPELRAWKARIEEAADRPACMTGSGAGYVVLARERDDLRAAEAVLREAGCATRVTTPVPRGVEIVSRTA